MKKSLIFAFTLVGTFVGAGFATGQEMVSFFTIKNPENPLYFVLSSALIFLCVKFSKDLSQKKDSYSFYITLFNKPIGTVMFFASLISLFICYGACAAGMGSVFFESFRLPYLSGAGLLTAISLIACIKGMKGINLLNSMLTPLIIIFIILFGIISILNPDYELIAFKGNAGISSFFALLYAGYNIFPLIPVTLEEKKNNTGILLAFVFVLALGIVLFYALKTHLLISLSSTVPFEAIIRSIYPYMGNLYAIIICMALVTTGAACLYGFVSHIEKSGKIKKTPLYILSVAATFLFLFFGFKQTVRIIYPLSGVFGAILILRIIMLRAVKK